MKTSRSAMLVAVCGAALALPSVALAQGTVVNVSGATLLENFVNQPSSTNDFIDVDGDGRCGLCPVNFPPDQLAPARVAPPFPADQHWTVQYFAVGSINGFVDLLNWGDAFVTSDASGAATDLTRLPIARVARAYNNRILYANAGVSSSPIFNAGNPYAVPNRSDESTLLATYAVPPTASEGGLRIDIAIIDVPGTWAVRIGEPGSVAVSPETNPAEPGYGANPRRSVNRTGGSAGADLPNFLPGLLATGRSPAIERNLFDPTAPERADANTLFDTPLFWAPIVPMVNYGAGLSVTTITDLQYLYGTGRRQNGENLVAVTRDIGSGTRNGWQNTIGQDPSFGVGDNVGNLSIASDEDRLGSAFTPNNKGGTSNVERTVINHRLAIGYVGGERGAGTAGSPGWLITNRADIPSVIMDIYGGTVPVRPTATNIFNPGPNGWNIGGPAAFVTLGDPRAVGPALGGEGLDCPCLADFDGSGGTPDGADIEAYFAAWLGGDISSDSDCSGGTPDGTDIDIFFSQWIAGGCIGANTNPPMANEQAAAFVNNIRIAIEDFVAFGPGDPRNDFSPGEWAARQFIVLAALPNIQNPLNPGSLVSNPAFNSLLQSATLPGSVYNTPDYAAYAFDNNGAGVAPDRRTITGATYSDGGTGANFILQDGTTVNDLAPLSGLLARNTIAGDFNGDGVRSPLDVPGMIAALRQRTGGPAWTAPDGIYGAGAGAKASIEILGDFTGDGNFNREDVRYFADGLHLVGGGLDRRAGFIAVDTAFGGNTFGTVLATGAAYTAGGARADVVGPSGLATPGFVPQSDGRVDANDINYVYNQFRNNPAVTDGEATWATYREAIGFDLSADMTGDRVVNQADVCAILSILGTNAGDVNLDGVTNAADLAIITGGVLPRPTSTGRAAWAEGDLNGDGVINAADVAIFNNPSSLCN